MYTSYDIQYDILQLVQSAAAREIGNRVDGQILHNIRASLESYGVEVRSLSMTIDPHDPSNITIQSEVRPPDQLNAVNLRLKPFETELPIFAGENADATNFDCY